MSDEGKLDARYKRLVDSREVERLKDYATTAHAEVARLTAALSEAVGALKGVTECDSCGECTRRARAALNKRGST